jgi:hypothetical protein
VRDISRYGFGVPAFTAAMRDLARIVSRPSCPEIGERDALTYPTPVLAR